MKNVLRGAKCVYFAAASPRRTSFVGLCKLVRLPAPVLLAGGPFHPEQSVQNWTGGMGGRLLVLAAAASVAIPPQLMIVARLCISVHLCKSGQASKDSARCALHAAPHAETVIHRPPVQKWTPVQKWAREFRHRSRGSPPASPVRIHIARLPAPCAKVAGDTDSGDCRCEYQGVLKASLCKSGGQMTDIACCGLLPACTRSADLADWPCKTVQVCNVEPVSKKRERAGSDRACAPPPCVGGVFAWGPVQS